MIARLTAPALLLVALWVAPLQAFELLRTNRDPCSNAQNLFWPSRGVAVSVDPLQPQSFRDLANQARDRWNQSVGTFRFVAGGAGFCNLNDGVSSLGFSAQDCTGADLGELLAITVSRWRNSTGELLDADVVFNVNSGELRDPDVFRQVAMHELGHVLGLGHSDACGASGQGTLMRRVLYLNEPRLFAPQTDDIQGALAIYPSSGGGQVESGQNSCATTVPRRNDLAPPLMLLPLLVALRRFLGNGSERRSI